MIGKVQWFDIKKRYGFIQIGPEENLFVHRREICFGKEGFKHLLPDQIVEFDIGEFQGKPTALNVRLASVGTEVGGQ